MSLVKHLQRITMSTVILATVSTLAIAAGPSPDPYADATKVVPVTELKFYQNKEGLTIANGWGDPAGGAHSNYIRMAGGTASGVHTHTDSYYGVVIAGVVVNEPTAGAPERPLPAGSYWYQKGGERHVTKCISQTECLFFVTSKGGFDYLPAK
ncbi:DUF4437 domain-containing protein [Roseateles sp. L2-2]|uniref:DUF4437 domain-containing protein n=1 Tax=Roseateles sp. L2-2 TaxID=3422597 RepID=UPI003D360C8B